MPEAIIAFLESSSYVDAVKNAISLGGDADTMACIAGGIAQAYYRQIPETIVEKGSGKAHTGSEDKSSTDSRGTYSCPLLKEFFGNNVRAQRACETGVAHGKTLYN